MILADKQKIDENFKQTSFNIVAVNYFCDGVFKREFKKEVKNLCIKHEIDVIHSFESYWATYELARIAETLSIGFYWTICGGRPPVTNFGLKKLAAFSQEIKTEFNRRGYKAEVAITPGRINFTQSTIAKIPELPAQIQNTEKLIFISRVSPRRLRIIKFISDAVNSLRTSGHNISFIHVGHCYNASDREALAQTIQKANQAQTGTSAYTIDPGLEHAAPYLRHATIAVGVGRSAFEAMAFDIPTLIVGEDGYAGLAALDNLPKLAVNNFSGRTHASTNINFDLTKFTEDTSNLITDRNYRETCLASARDWIKKNLDVKVAVDDYLQQYQIVRNSLNTPCHPAIYYLHPSLIKFRVKKQLRRLI